MRARLARQRDDVADQIAQQHRAAPVQVRDREHAALAVRQAAAGLRIDHFEMVEVGRDVLAGAHPRRIAPDRPASR